MTRPRLLDLFCGAGGAAMGYHRAGFEVVGVDIAPQPHYPFEFSQVDALLVLEAAVYKRRTGLGVSRVFDEGFDAIHASPPCQLFSRAGKLREAQGRRPSAVNLVPETRTLLQATGRPYIIENVEGAPIEGVFLCGSAFGLGVRRHRIFESNILLFGAPCRHREQGRPIGVYYRPGDDIPGGGRTARNIAEAQQAMGIDWMPRCDELKEAIPPAYTEHLGRQLLAALEAAA